jgi:glycine/D-amino acid oxidase-like deaminating enzyme
VGPRPGCAVSGTSLPRQAATSWWIEEARADPSFEAGEPFPALTGDVTADVVILGGGYTGMWTAWFLKERDPSVDVVLLEQETCGSGPSGRNGGFCYGFWEDLPSLVRRFGDGEGVRIAEVAQRSVGEIEAWCKEHDVDAWFTRGGHLTIATSSAQDGAWRELLEEAERLGVAGGRFEVLTPEQVRQRCDSPVFRGGLFQPPNAILQPARLALGLRRELLRRGVRIFERSPVTRFSGGSRVRVRTPSGSVTADKGVLGLGAWTSSIRRFHRAVVPRGTYIVVTEPVPDALDEIGWTGGEGLADWRTALRYFRTTKDGRIAFGAASAAAGLGVGLGPRLRYDERSVTALVEDVHRFFPMLRDVRFDAAWGGPMDITGAHLPSFGTLDGGSLLYGVGYTGGGVGPTHLGGKILSALALGTEDEHTALPLVGMEPMRFPPEPFLSVGAAVTQRAIVRKDDAEDRETRADPLTEFVARLPRLMGYELGP